MSRRVGTDLDSRPAEQSVGPKVGVTVARTWRSRFPSLPAAVVLGLGALAAYELVRVARLITSRLANEDTSIIWVAARDLLSGHLRQPNYYGQSYGSTLEAVPIGVVHALGASWGPATSFVLAAVEWAGWALLAWAAWRRGRRIVAALAVATPVLLTAYHTVYVTIELQAPGPRLLVIAAAALLIAASTRPVALAVAVLLLGVGLQFDAASALLGVPVAVWFGISYLRSRRQLYAIAVGGVIPAVQFAYTKLFYQRHPDYAFHGSPSLRPSASTLSESGGHLREFFALYAPELWRSWLVPVAALAVLTALLIATRRMRYALPAVLAAVIVPYAMSTSRARPEWSLGPLLPRGRILLALPATIWFLFFLVAESGIFATVSTRIGARKLLTGVVVVCLASTAVRVGAFDSRLASWYRRSIAFASQGLYAFTANVVVDRQCDEAVALARRYGVRLIVYQAQHQAYSCAARAPSGIATLVAGFDRRTWALYDEVRNTRSGLLLADPAARICDVARQRAACTRQGSYVILKFGSQPALPFLTAIGFEYRGFGPHCHPTGTFASCRDGRGGADLTRRPFGRPPVDQLQARAAITSSYESMFQLAANGAGFPNVELGDRLAGVTTQFSGARQGPDTTAVLDVRFLDDHEAAVRFRLGPRIATGEAVFEGGRWRVALPTFCSAASSSASSEMARLAKVDSCYRAAVA